MLLINFTFFLLMAGIILIPLGQILKKKKILISGIISLILISVLWVVIIIWGLVEEDAKYNRMFSNNQVLEFINTCMYEFLNRPFKELQDIMNIERHYIKNGGNFWIAINNKKIIGTIALENRGNIGILKRLYIKNDYQHKGIGTDLYNTFEEYIKEKTNIKTIYLACGKILENAHKFYIKNGFKKIDNLEIECIQ